MAFYPLEKLHVLRDGYRKSFLVAGRQLLLIEMEGSRFLVENRCPHAGSPLHDATLQDGSLRCPMHGICFDLQTGEADTRKDSGDSMRLVYFKLIYRDNVVGVEL